MSILGVNNRTGQVGTKANVTHDVTPLDIGRSTLKLLGNDGGRVGSPASRAAAQNDAYPMLQALLGRFGIDLTPPAQVATPPPAQEPIELQSPASGILSDHAKTMIALANDKQRTVRTEVMGVVLLASPNDTVDDVMRPFYEARAKRDAAVGAAETNKAASQLARREHALAEFLAGGGKIIDTPPSWLPLPSLATFDIKGSDGTPKTLDLVTHGQLDHLPEGTRLTSISGKEHIVGLDAPNVDTRGNGFSELGFMR